MPRPKKQKIDTDSSSDEKPQNDMQKTVQEIGKAIKNHNSFLIEVCDRYQIDLAKEIEKCIVAHVKSTVTKQIQQIVSESQISFE